MSKIMTDPAAIRVFTLAGNAVLTLRSARTDRHYTYRITVCGDKPHLFFVAVLTDGGDGTYTYVGTLTMNGGFLLTSRSRFTPDAPCVRAFRYFYDHVLVDGVVPPGLEVRHEGRCGRCGRGLTDPDSIDRGIGPICAGLVAA